jgi:hypothetical protein
MLSSSNTASPHLRQAIDWIALGYYEFSIDRKLESFRMARGSLVKALVVFQLEKNVEAFLRDELRLELAPHKVQIGNVSDGISFVGYRIFPHCVRIRSDSLRRFRKKIARRKGADFWKSLASFSGHASFVDGFLNLYQSFLERADV